MRECFVGRVNERAVLTDAMARARVGRPVAVLVTGEPGIGKSTLLARVVAEAERSGFRSVTIAADRVDAVVPRAALRLAFEEVVAHERDPSLLDTASALQAALARRPTEPAGGDLPHLVQRLLEGWAFRSPVLIGVDDLHFADPQTSATVLHLMRAVRLQRVLVVATTRPAPALASGVETALTQLREQGAARVVELSALRDDELVELVRGRIGHEPSPRFLELLRDRSGGTPLFAIELLDAMERSGDLVVRDDHVDVAGAEHPALPTRLSTAVLHRVFGLEPDARAVARAAAVIGTVPAHGLGLVASVAGLEPARAASAFGVLERAGILVAVDGDHRFAHALVRDAIYHDIGPAARRRLHGRVTAALAAGGPWGPPDIVEVAKHVVASTGGHDTTAATALVAAGDALADSTPLAAAAWYRAALARLAPDDACCVDVQLALSRVLELAGAHDEAARIAAAARTATADPSRQERAATQAAGALLAAGRDERAIELLDEAAADPARRTPAIVLHLAAALQWTDRRHEAPGLLAEARRHGAHDVREAADALDVFTLLAAGRFAAADRSRRTLRAAIGRAAPAMRPVLDVSSCAASAFDFLPRDAIAIADASSPDGPRAGLLAALASWARYRAGAFADVERLGAVALGACERGSVEHGLWLTALMATRVERGDPAAGELVVAAADRSPGGMFETGLDIARASCRRADGDHDGAEEIVTGAIWREAQRGQVDFLALALAAAVETAVERGDTDVAKARNEQLQALGDDAGVAVIMCRLHAQAITHSDLLAASAARDHAVRHGLGADASRALGVIGALRGDAGLLDDAYRELGEIGAVRRQRAVARELRRIGRRVPPTATRTEQFSPVEDELVSLVADGLTNRQVAARMGLSAKTVEVYLSRIYRKAGLRSRVELAVAVRDGRLGTLVARGDRTSP